MSGATELLSKAIQFLKYCPQCRKRKWNSEFSKNKGRLDGSQTYCKDCRNKNYRKYDFKSNYNITEEDYELMLELQNGKCAICGQSETSKDCNGNIRQLSIDHDHLTNKIRGLLCNRCNQILGKVKDNIETLKQAIKYLEDNQ